ncbi:MAG: CoA transferase [Chloroflexi bacterium]|nr:CoA transferase [Chloroflexota bacterium]
MAIERTGDSLLAGYRILDLADGKAMLTGQVLACLGADVIKVERPGGDSARAIGPFYKDQVHPERSLYWFYTNAGKRGITLDITQPDGQALFKKLVRTADAVVESFEPGYLASLGLGYEDLCKVKPDIVMTSVSPYGQAGPYAHFKHSNLTTWSMGGQTFISGEPEREPIQRYLHQADFQGGLHGAMGTMLALTHRDLSGEGQHVDVSIQHAVALTMLNCAEFWDLNKYVWKRAGKNILWPRIDLPTFREPIVYPCKDGWLSTRGLYGGTKGSAEAALAIMRWASSEGHMQEIKDYDPYTFDVRTIKQEEWDPIEKATTDFFLTKSCQEVMDRSAAEGMQVAPCNTVADLWTSPHFRARGFWEQVVEHPELGDAFVYPGPPVRSAERFWRISRRAPLIGEHNEEILVGELGGSSSLTGAPSSPAAGSLRTDGDGIPRSGDPEGGSAAEPYRRKGILTGVKIVDFSWVGAGPQVSRELANHGAQVIRVECHKFPDMLRLTPPYKDTIAGLNRSGLGMCFNTSKYSVCLRLDKPRGREIAKRLIKRSDIMLQSMSAGVMARWGLDYESVREFKPDIIYYSTTQPGLVGPYRTFEGNGYHGAAYAGFEAVAGYRDLCPDGVPSAYTDLICPWYGVVFLLGALARKRRTGEGTLLDQSQWEAGVHFLGPAILDYIVNGRVATPLGNRDPDNCPQGVFPCRGDDRWVAVAVEDDRQWEAFSAVVGERWIRDARFATFPRRKENEDELEKLIEEWTKNKLAEEVMQMLQDAGVPAGVVQNSQDLVDYDPQMKHRRAYQWLEHRVIGRALHNTPAYRLAKTPHHLLKAGPIIGEDNDYVYKEVLGLGDDEIGDLYAEGVIDTEYDITD